MCTPMMATMFQALGAISQARGQKQAAAAKAQEYEYQAKIDDNNRKVALWKAQDAQDRGAKEEDGSALDILGDTAALGELDALTIRSNAEREAYENKVNASNLAANAGMKRMGAANSLIAGRINATTSLLSGAGSIASKWANYST